MGEGYYWVGQCPFHKEGNRIVLSGTVVDRGVADTERPLYWAFGTKEDAVVVSQIRGRFDCDERFEYINETWVGPDRLTAVPRGALRLVSEFDRGECLHFVMIEEYAPDAICMVLPGERP